MAAVNHGYNEAERRKVVKVLWDAGIHTVAELVLRSGLPRSTVRGIRTRILEGRPIQRKVGSGGMRHLSPVAIGVMRAEVQLGEAEKRAVTAAKIRERVLTQTGEEVCIRTMRRALHREGMEASRPRKGPDLKPHHEVSRMTWSLAYQEENWDRTEFVDEARFQLHRNNVLVWHPRGETPRRGIPLHSPAVHALAGISSTGVSPLVLQVETWNAERWIAAMNDQIQPLVSTFYEGQHRYLPDNAPCHTAQETRQWAEATGVNLFFQPALSPDLQPMENLWAEFKHKVELRAPTTIAQLRQVMEEEWAQFTVDDIAPYWESMRRRMDAVVHANGSWTKY